MATARSKLSISCKMAIGARSLRLYATVGDPSPLPPAQRAGAISIAEDDPTPGRATSTTRTKHERSNKRLGSHNGTPTLEMLRFFIEIAAPERLLISSYRATPL